MLGTTGLNRLPRCLLASPEYWAVQQGLVLDGKLDARQNDLAARATPARPLPRSAHR